MRKHRSAGTEAASAGRSREAGRREEPNPTVAFSSNEIRLSPRQCGIAAAVLLLAFYGLPRLWEHWEPFQPDSDYRMPFELGNDYWLFSRYCRSAASRDQTIVLGDSVVWGHYVGPAETLSHYLNELAGRPQFANL
ncbi:MAG: hypothetical protein GXP27_04090, partial [Planctomycetes bacterium]|nr:hypothetical protein [Planctomycetota bacterium]